MSWDALAWAAKQTTQHAADKLVLIGLADRWNSEDQCAWPSIDWLCEFGCLNRKTVITALDRLEQAGMIADSGLRKGRTAQVKVYRLLISERVPEKEQSQNRNSSTFSRKESQKRDTEPLIEPLYPSDATHPQDESVSRERANDPAQDMADRWNSMAEGCGLPKVAKLTPERRRKVMARIKDHGVDAFTEAIARVGRSPFCTGSTGWRASFDFLLQPSSFVKVLEGTYDDRPRTAQSSGHDRNGGTSRDPLGAYLDRAVEQAGRDPEFARRLFADDC